MSYVNIIKKTVEYSRANNCNIMLVAQEKNICDLRKILILFKRPVGEEFSGRTLRLDNNSYISLLHPDDPNSFIFNEKPFYLVLLGGSSNSLRGSENISKWIKQAEKQLEMI
jgi:hypothetical protein